MINVEVGVSSWSTDQMTVGICKLDQFIARRHCIQFICVNADTRTLM